MIPEGFGDEFMIVTPAEPDEAYEQLIVALRDDWGYLLVQDSLCLIRSTELQEDGRIFWSIHRCQYANGAMRADTPGAS